MACLTVAAGLRLWRLDLTVFEVDEAAILRLAEDMLRLGRVPLSGPVFSAGVPSAPHFIYLLAPLLAISRDPAFVAGAVALANVLGVLTTAWLGWRAFGPVAGLSAAALYAVNPRAVFYARHIWQPEILPPLAAVLFVALDLAVVERRAWWAAATLPIVVLASLIHPSFATLAPLLLAPAAVLVSARRWVPLIVGGALACLTTLPYVIHQLQTRWIDVVNFRYYSSLHTWVDLDSVRYALGLATGLVGQNDPTVPPLDRGVPGVLVQIGAGLETALLLGAIAFGLFMVAPRRRPTDPTQRQRLLGLLLWLLLPVVLTVRHTLPLQAHYYLVLYPAPFLLIGAAFAWLVRDPGHAPPSTRLVALHEPRPRERLVRLTLLGAACALSATTLIQGASVVRALQDIADGPEPCVATLLPTTERAEREMVDLGSASGAATSHAAVELQAPDSLPLAYLLRSHFPAVDLAGAGSIGLESRMPPGGAWSSLQSVPPVLTRYEVHDAQYQSGLQLVELAYADAPQPSQSVTLALSWLVPAEVESNHAFVWDVALVDRAGQVVFRHPGVDHLLAELRGQRIVSWLTVDPTQTAAGQLLPGSYRWRLQLIDAWASEVVPFADALGQQTRAATLEVGPIDVSAPLVCGGG